MVVMEKVKIFVLSVWQKLKTFFSCVWHAPSVLLIPLATSISNMLIGFDGDVLPSALIYINYEFYAKDKDKAVLQDILRHAPTGGAILGAGLGTFLNDHRGRKLTILVSDGFFFSSSVVTICSMNYHTLIVGRLLYGIGVGLMSLTMPLFVAEFSPPELRGTLIGLSTFFEVFGTCLSSYVTSFTQIWGSWRWMFGIAAIFPVLQYRLMNLLPETPMWIFQQGMAKEKEKDKEKLMAKVKSSLKFVYPPDQAKAAFTRLLKSAKKTSNGVLQENFYFKVKEAWGNLRVFKTIFVGVCVQIAQQIVGLSSVVKFSPSMLQFWGYDPKLVDGFISDMNAKIGVLVFILNTALVELFGRRKILVSCLIIIFFLLISLATVFSLAETTGPHIDPHEFKNKIPSNITCSASSCWDCFQKSCGVCVFPGKEENHLRNCVLREGYSLCRDSGGLVYDLGCPNPMGFISVLLLHSFVLIFSLGLGSIPSTINAEIYPIRFRGLGGGISTVIKWLVNLMFPLTFSTYKADVDAWKLFLFHALCCALILIPIIQFLPEVAGIPMEEIDESFEENSSSGSTGQSSDLV